MTIERIIVERDNPKDGNLILKDRTILRVIIEAYDEKKQFIDPVETSEERTFTTGDESQALSEILLALATKIRPPKPSTQKPQ